MKQRTTLGFTRYLRPAGILASIAIICAGAAYAFSDPAISQIINPSKSRSEQPSATQTPSSTTPAPEKMAQAPIFSSPESKIENKVETKIENKPESKVEAKSDALGCLVEPSIVVDVSSPVSGLLDRVAVERGDKVQQGQIVASLESRVEKASVALAMAKLNNDAEIRSAESNQDFARRKHERNETLHKDGVVSAQIREQAESESVLASERLKQTREQRSITVQEVQLARSQLSLKTISSPIAGVVIERYLSSGERADDKPIVRIAQIHPLRVEAILPAAMYGKVKHGMSARVQAELPGEKARDAAVTLVDKVIDPASNTFRVRLELPNADYALPSGVRCKINLVL
jgi:membrane fusion protein, heavy metal efflux system